MSDMTTKKQWADTRVDIMNGLSAYVLPGAMYGLVVAYMAEAGCTRAKTIEEADIVVFVGGADVTPEIYKQAKMAGTYNDFERDQVETEIYHKCLERGQVMFGICRGAQFLHVMNGGQLWQDVNNHGGRDHEIYDIEEDVHLTVTSYHHQMLALTPDTDLEVLAVCSDQIATRFKSDTMTIDLKKEGSNVDVELEIEAGYYNKSKCFFVQGHPECGSAVFKSWTMNKLKDFYHEWKEEAPADEPEMSVEDQVDLWRSAALM